MESEYNCAYISPRKDERGVCGESVEIESGVSYSITAGFAHGTRAYRCLKPKWQQKWTFSAEVERNLDPDVFFSLKDDYCIYAITGANPDGSRFSHPSSSTKHRLIDHKCYLPASQLVTKALNLKILLILNILEAISQSGQSLAMETMSLTTQTDVPTS